MWQLAAVLVVFPVAGLIEIVSASRRVLSESSIPSLNVRKSDWTKPLSQEPVAYTGLQVPLLRRTISSSPS